VSSVLEIQPVISTSFKTRSITHRLNIDIRSSDLVDETTLPNVGVTADQQRPGVGIDGWETRDMLPDLLEVGKGVFLTTHDGRHSKGEIWLDQFGVGVPPWRKIDT
jgi:hypothetical protein